MRADSGSLPAWEELMIRAEDLIDAGRLREADAAFAAADRFAREKSLPAENRVGSLLGRIDCLSSLYDYLALRDVSRQILEVQLTSGDEPGAAKTRLDLGFIETFIGNPRAGAGYLKTAAQWFSRAKESAQHAQALSRLAFAQYALRRFASALDAAEAADDFFREAGDDLSRAETLNILGLIYLDLAEFDRARERFEEGLALLGDTETPARTDFLINLASVRMRTGDRQGALSAYRRARQAIPLTDRGTLGAVLLGEAEVLIDLKEWTGARKAVVAAVKTARDYPVVRAYASRILGRLELAEGRLDEAEKSFREAGELGTVTGDSGLLFHARVGLAEVMRRTRRIDEATKEMRRALVELETSTRGLSPLSSVLIRGRHAQVFDLALDLAFRQPDLEVTFELMERVRAAILLQSLGREGLDSPQKRSALDAGTRQAAETLQGARLRFLLVRRTGERKAIRRALLDCRQAQAVYQEVLQRAQRSVPRDALGMDGRFESLSRTASLLAPEEALVLYASGGDLLRALVVRRTGTCAVELGPRADIQAAVDALGRAAAAGSSSSRDSVDPETVRELILAPLGLPKTTTRLLICPEGGLAYLPWGLLLPDREWALVPSATTWGLLKGRSDPRGTRILALGDPDYEIERGDTRLLVYAGGKPLDSLLQSRAEVEDVTGPKDARLLGKDATESALRRLLSEKRCWRSVHLACHGIHDRARPAWSALALTPDEQHDGFLTVLEVFGLKVSADLVVLSACDTGRGRLLRGEGLVGLSTAFLGAGAPRVLASLWRVNDAATRAFMVEFYRLLKLHSGEGMGAAAALKGAQEHVRGQEGWSHPHYWAAWVLWGLAE